jgi:hypothetical protein
MTSDELTTPDRDLLFRAVTLAGGQWIGVQKPLIAGLPEWLVFRNPSTKRVLTIPLHLLLTRRRWLLTYNLRLPTTRTAPKFPLIMSLSEQSQKRSKLYLCK